MTGSAREGRGLDTVADVPGVAVGHAEVEGGGSGCTVILGPFRGVAEVHGVATGTRELPTLDPTHTVPEVDAILFTGGSAFGLAAADGVMAWMEQEGRGYATGAGRVPIVPAAVIYDLAEGRRRPGPGEGRRACAAAGVGPVAEGRVGAGAGARAGMIRGIENAISGGVGSASIRHGGFTVGALAVVNSVGVVRGRSTEGSAGGLGGHDERTAGGRPAPGADAGSGPTAGTHTTLAAVVTDAPLGQLDLVRLSRIAAAAFARTIDPVHTPFDGDILVTLSTGALERDERARAGGRSTGVETGHARMASRDLLALGIDARDVLERAIVRAVEPRPELKPEGSGS
jgi:L-aminopeptidase/D-esterase-like protein